MIRNLFQNIQSRRFVIVGVAVVAALSAVVGMGAVGSRANATDTNA